MLRPESCARPAGGSPVRVDTGVPGSRPQFVGEIWRAERGVESLFGGSKPADRSIKRILQPRQRNNGGAEPLMSRRRPRPAGPVPGSQHVGSLRGTGSGMWAWSGTEQERPVCACVASRGDRPDKPMVKPAGAQRESDGVVVPTAAAGQHNPRSGKGPDFGHAGRGGMCKGMAGTARPNHPGRRWSAAAHRGTGG